MALSLRKRGKVWHARGTVRVGREVVHVPEFSTGQGARADAEAVSAAEEDRIRTERLEGPAGRARRLTIADCIETYSTRPRGVSVQDAAKIARINDAIGDRTLDRLREAWAAWQARHGHHSPGTATRYRALLMAAVRACCEARDIPPPRLPGIARRREDRIAHLTDTERASLLRSYSPHAACPVLLLAYQGMRTREVLRLTWRDVDWRTDSLRIPAGRAKSGRGRAVPMHPRVRMLLWGMWKAAGEPQAGEVFISSRGDPYADTRDIGGNPLAAAHRTACARAGVTGFRVHDWRHDWAARMVLAGVDLVTLMELGGWADLSMVQRYASIRGDHRREAIARLA
jgi:integrase